MQSQTKIRISDSVVAREIAGEMMLMDLDSGTYFGLDAVGARIWQSLEQGEDVASLYAKLEGEYDVPPAQLRNDVDELLEELKKHNLVSTEGQ